MEYKSINPYDQTVIATHQGHSHKEAIQVLDQSQAAFETWKNKPLSERCALLHKAAEVLEENVEKYARTITLEMGKPINEARGEVRKCAWVCRYYADNVPAFLEPEVIETDASKSFVRHDPIGTVLAIMPWNFPFWQVFRYAAPTLTAGNTGILKHATNVLGCAKHIAEVFELAGYPDHVFQNLFVGHDMTETVISHDAIRAVTLTGSERAGSTVAAIAGKYLKKTVLELGGSNAFIVWEDADVDQAVATAVNARMLNTGQSCIAAKRFLLLHGIYDEFVEKFTKAVAQLKSGQPLLDATQVGPLAREDLAEELHRQVRQSIDKGAELLYGGHQDEAYHQPTVLGNVKPGMPAFDEETFGPLAAMVRVQDEAEAMRLANQSSYGLGLSICTKNIDKALSMAGEVSDGALFINELVKSDPRLPFGGTKTSGYGRELSRDGLLEFVNRKTVYVK